MAIQPHGTRTRYTLNGCRCGLCSLANAQYQADLKKGVRRSVTTGPVREHIAALRADGWTLQAIADRSGYHVQTISNIANGRTLWTSRYASEDILSIPLAEVAA